jgi:hypothetical protein
MWWFCISPVVLLHLLKPVENQGLEMAPTSAQQSCYKLLPTSRFKVWNKNYIFIQNRDN